jgi:hypothetical protein
VLAHPFLIVESFGVKVLVRALFAGEGETFLEIVSRSAEDEAHLGEVELGLARSVRRFIGFERRIGALYRSLSQQLSGDPEAARFFRAMSAHEEGHAIVLSRVRREIRRGRLWKRSRDLHAAAVGSFEARLESYEEEVGGGVSLARALEIAEGIERSEINVVFDSLNASVDMRSRARFERFFVLTQRHVAYCAEQVLRLRARSGIAPSTAS